MFLSKKFLMKFPRPSPSVSLILQKENLEGWVGGIWQFSHFAMKVIILTLNSLCFQNAENPLSQHLLFSFFLLWNIKEQAVWSKSTTHKCYNDYNVNFVSSTYQNAPLFLVSAWKLLNQLSTMTTWKFKTSEETNMPIFLIIAARWKPSPFLLRELERD